ncbi:MAG TPA: xanthine dehydrogenase family protein molybdopterin-binding subunit [Rhizobiaceae bacterium]|nr:xanthine dehydrogenase family protein molybdopterin-binding subunit [Rhizobiaceae bacterium]
MNAIAPKFGVGASVLRREDPKFITGKGCYTDDIKQEGMLHGYVLRSPIANGGFKIVDIEAAKTAPGVHVVLTGADVAHLGDLTSPMMAPGPDGVKPPTRDVPILCKDSVHHVGDAVAFIAAESLNEARDAAELIEVEWQPRDAVADTREALAEGAPLVWPELGSNVAFIRDLGDKAEVDAVFAGAAKVTRIEFVNNRLVCNYMEPRAAIGEWIESENRFLLTCGSQGVHNMRDFLEGWVYRGKEKVHVVTPDVGGGFGPKTFPYREYALVLEAARHAGRPVKWYSDRTEHFLSDAQGRDNAVAAEMAMDENGRFLALGIDIKANMGGYIHAFAPFIPWLGAIMATGVYDIQKVYLRITGVYSNTVPVDAYRGAGRPEAAFLIEKLVEACARDLGKSSVELRRLNFIKPEQFPYRTPGDRLYDVGEYDGHLTAALAKADWDSFETRAAEAKANGRIRGIGLSTYVEACAFAGSEPALVRLEEDGTVTLDIGTQSNGQGHATAYAQFVAEKLNLDIDSINMIQGDSDRLEKGGGTGGSRSIPLGGVSASRAGEALAEKIRKLAADELEAAAADIELETGEARVVGTDRRVSFAEIAKKAASKDDLKAWGEFDQNEATYPNGTHICEVEIDPDTGKTQIVRYTIVDDFGVTVNPILLAGQVHGGVVQGAGQALTENTVYGEDGQLLTASFMDYGMPRADDFPSFDFSTRNVPSTTNALGIKGAGEAGTIGATPAVLNAVTDALWREYGIGHIEMPCTPQRVWETIQSAGK